MATATKAPPMIAPGVLCPKCKGPMLDERTNKRTDKSPDYTCANMLCTDATGKYRTAIWAKGNGSGAEGTGASAPSVGGNTPGALLAPAPSTETPSEKPRLDRLYLRATKLIIDEVVPLYTKAGIGCSDTAVAAMAATLFIAASKVEAH